MTTPTTPRLIRQITLLSAAAFCGALSTRISDPILPLLAASFGATIGESAQVVSAYALAYGGALLIYGPLGDRYGKFRVITLATVASLMGALGSAIAFSLTWLTLFRFLNGATAAALIPLSMAWIGDNVPYERRQQILAHFMSGQILGFIGGQAMGGLLADVAGWRSVFYFQCLAYLLVGAALVLEVRRSPDIDPPAGADLARLSFFRQVHAVVHQRWPRQVLMIVFAEGLFVFGPLAFIPSLLHHKFGVSLTLAGFSMGMFGLGGLCYTTLARFFVRRLGERGMALAGGGLLSLAFAMLLGSNAWPWALPAAWCAGLGYYMLHNTLQTHATQMAPHARGTAVALFAGCLFTGQSIGVWLASMSIDLFGFQPMLAAAAVCLPVIGAVFARKVQRRPGGENPL